MSLLLIRLLIGLHGLSANGEERSGIAMNTFRSMQGGDYMIRLAVFDIDRTLIPPATGILASETW